MAIEALAQKAFQFQALLGDPLRERDHRRTPQRRTSSIEPVQAGVNLDDVVANEGRPRPH
jgi:hypothetical protein